MEDQYSRKMNYSGECFVPDNLLKRQLEQIKTQIIAYKYLIKNINIPIDVIEKITNFQYEEWKTLKEKSIQTNQKVLENKFENHDLVINFLNLNLNLTILNGSR